MKGFSIILLLVGLTSCDGTERFKGEVHVKDSNTKHGDSGIVVIRIKNPSDFQITSEDGKFEFNFIVMHPKDEEFMFYKPGYAPLKKKLTGLDTIYLERK